MINFMVITWCKIKRINLMGGKKLIKKWDGKKIKKYKFYSNSLKVF